MPLKPLRPCRKSGCTNLTQEGYCQEHSYLAEQEKRERNQYYDRKKRDKKAEAFYKSGEWDRARQQALIRDHGLCQDCLAEKQITFVGLVDHIIPLKVAWHLRTTLSNLRSLCDRHHAAKTAEDRRKYKG